MKYLYIGILSLVAFVANGQGEVITKDLEGTSYTVSQHFPPEILGKYTYEGKGEPIVLLNEDGTGLFQPHGVAPIKIKFWIDCDETGKWRRQDGIEGRYQYTLLIQYQESDSGNYPSGKYDLMGVAVLHDLGRAVIYGERYKALTP
jgi:hypothetical protein